MSEGGAKPPIGARGSQTWLRLEHRDRSGSAGHCIAGRCLVEQSTGAKAQECLTIK